MQQKVWSATAACGLRDCCYLPNNVDHTDCLVAAGTDGALHVCHHPERQGTMHVYAHLLCFCCQACLPSVNSLYSSAPDNCHSACSYSANCTADEIVHVLLVVPATEHAFVTCCGPGDTAEMHCCHPWAQSLLCVNSSEDGTFLAAGGKLMS